MLTAEQVRRLIEGGLEAVALRNFRNKGFHMEARQTTTGSEQIRLTVDGETFNITITKARS